MKHTAIERRVIQDFGNAFRDARESANLSQAEVAERLGTTQSYISRIEAGRGNPTLAKCATLLHLLGFQLWHVVEPRK